MQNIEVSIDTRGEIFVSEPSLNNNTGVTWLVTGGAITNITKGDAFNGTPVKDGNGNWSAKIRAGNPGQRAYELTARATDPNVSSERKTPKITVVAV